VQPILKAQCNQSRLVIVDMQQRLADAMPANEMKSISRQCGILLQAAKLLEIPILYTEHYPKGLGPTIPELMPQLATTARIEKTAFSCPAEPGFSQHLTSDRPQIILAGMESHICILQTALDLHASGRQVFVAEDAVLSRNAANKTNALHRLRQAGIVVSNTESIVFEWLGKAEGEAFKQISRLIR
jgi:nicotinamidase-related amidase